MAEISDLRGKSQQSYRIADTLTLNIGDYAALNASGDLQAVADTASFVPKGLVTGFSDAQAGSSDVGDTSAAEPPEAVVNTAGGILHNVSVTGVTGEGDKGALVYTTAPDTWTLTPTANISAVGEVARFLTGTNVDLELYSAETIRGL